MMRLAADPGASGGFADRLRTPASRADRAYAETDKLTEVASEN